MRRLAMIAALVTLAGLVAASGGALLAAAGVSPGQTLRVSVQSNGEQSKQPNLHPAVSADGRWVVFSSRDQLDTSAVADSTPTPQVFVHDLLDNTTRLLSLTYTGEGINTQGVAGNGTSDFPTISADGRYVAFQTTSAIVSGDDISKIILVDRDPDGDGILDEPVGSTILLGFTLLSDEGELADPAFFPSISVTPDNGVQVVYEERRASGPSQLSGLVLARATPVVSPPPIHYTVARQVLTPQGPSGTFLVQAWAPTISANGERVVANAVFASVPEIALAPAPTVPAAAAASGASLAAASLAAAQSSFGDNVRVVAFDLDAVEPDGGDVPSVRLDAFTQAVQHREGSRPRISDDGRKAVFEVNVLPCATCNQEPRVFLADPDADGDGSVGPASAPELLSRDNAGDAVPAIAPAISGDGRFVAFATDALGTHNGVDLPAGDFGCTTQFGDVIGFVMAAQVQSACQIVARDLVLDQRLDDAEQPRLPGELASPSVSLDCPGFTPGDTCASDGVADLPALSGDGGVVVYSSDAADLLEGDDNGEIDVFARRFTPIATATPDPLDVGGVQIEQTVNGGTVITAVGFGPLKIQSVAVTGAGFALGGQTCAPRAPLYQLDTASTCAVSVDFTPATEGAKSGSIDITPAFGDVVHIPLRGTGSPFPQPDPAFVVQPGALNFGERLVFTDSTPATVTVTNAGDSRLTIAAVSLPPLLAPSAPQDYRITGNTCAGATLAANASCTVTLVHQPQGPGERPAVLQFDQAVPPTGAGLTQPHLVQLTGAGTKPAIQVNPGVTPVGRLTTVSGAGFPPGHAVSITMPGFPELVRVTPDASGVFTQALLVFPNAVPGSRTVQATVDGTTITDSQPLLVVPGTLGPPDFLVRR